MKFGIGQAVVRKEDPRLLKGEGLFLDDVRPEGRLYAQFLRSPVAHAKVLSVNVDEARRAPGVRLVYTYGDIADRLAPIRLTLPVTAMGGPETPPIQQPHLAKDRVRYVGQPVACVIAESIAAAKDAIDLIEFDFEELDVVTDSRAALAHGAPELHDEAPGNLIYDWTTGDEAATDAAFASAAHIAAARTDNQRLIVTAMEPRGIIATYDADRWEVWACSQGPHGFRGLLSAALKVDPQKVRVHTPDIGGGFGMKIMAHPEYALVALGAKDLGLPVKWIADRSESFLADVQARDLQTEMEGAFDADGRLLAMRFRSWSNVGAYLSTAGAAIHSVFSAMLVGGMYRLPVFSHRVRAAVTNTTPTDAYRGAGRPEVIHCTERLMDAAARSMGVDPVELRRRNLVTAADAPHKTHGGMVFDAQDPTRLIDSAIASSDYAGFDARLDASADRGLLRGRALVYYMERTGGGPDEIAKVEIGESGETTIRVGTQTNGQGHETTWAQVLVDNLGLDFDSISLAAGDSDALPFGGGTGGSRSLIMASRTIQRASDDVIEQTRPKAAEELEVAEADVEYRIADGAFAVAGTDRTIRLTEVVAKMGGVTGAGEVHDRENTYPNGAHVAEVEIDPETGVVTLASYTMADDAGRVVNPLVAGGQMQGGIAQGAGQALVEQGVSDPETGQPLTASFMDYAMPRADMFPALEPNFVEVPTPSNPYGVKGCGEAGTVAAIPAVTLAVHDALARAGGELIEGPFTPERVWRALGLGQGRTE